MVAMDEYASYVSRLSLSKGKTIVITGGNSGIGFAMAKHLAALEWKIILAVRNLSRGEKAKEELVSLYPQAQVEVWELDVSKRKSIDAFIARINEKRPDIDAFYCNAGVYRIPYQTTEEGLELTVATNYIGNYLLYIGLKDYFLSLGHTVRFLLTSSITARFERFSVEDFRRDEKHYGKMSAYARSKVAVNQLYLYLKDDCVGTNILPLLVHPGSTYTPLIDKAYEGRPYMKAAQRFMRIAFHTPAKASLCTLYALQDTVTAPLFVGPRGPFHLSGYPKVYGLYRGNLKKYRATIEATERLLQE